MMEHQEIYCHNCAKYVQFDLDMELNGKHVLKCPNCGHEHCRYVNNGKIMDERWASRNQDNIQTYTVSSYTLTYSTSSTTTTATSTANLRYYYSAGDWF
jgi:DNA-directed RNA polymerase subunit RPC12/RpoP